MKGQRRILSESRAITAKAWRERGLLDLHLLSLAASMYHRGDSEEALKQMDEIVARIRKRWDITPLSEREVWRDELAAGAEPATD